MPLLQIIKIIVAGATALLGLYLIVRPDSIGDFTGVIAANPRGRTEIRAGMGAFFAAVGAAPIVFNSEDMYLMLGVTYLFAGVVRAITMFLTDRSANTTNIASLASEIVFGVLLVL